MDKVIIIGAGVIGSAIARELSRYQLDIRVIERESDVCEVTSMANSAIIHSGYDPKPGTLKAKLNVLGNQMFDKLSGELGFEFERIGSLTVALNEEDLATLKELQSLGLENGVETEILNHDESLRLEPFLNPEVKYTLFAKTCGIVNPFEYTVALMENAMDNGVKLNLNEEVIGITKEENHYLVKTTKSVYEADIVINAAGLGSGKIAEMIGNDTIKITPRKGEYFVLDHFSYPYVTHTIFPLPSKKGKGILVTPTTHGNYLVGPSSEVVLEDDDFSTDTTTLNNVRESAKTVVSSIPFGETIRSFSGLRSTPSTHDFIICEDENFKGFYHAAGIESPGLASSYAIAKYLIDIIKESHNFGLNKGFNPIRRPFIKLNKMSMEERNEYYKRDKRFAHLICRCERISEGEILDCINRNCGAMTIRGVKKRIRPGFGKCQGGFCESHVLALLAKELKRDPKDIRYGNLDSVILKYNSKEDD